MSWQDQKSEKVWRTGNQPPARGAHWGQGPRLCASVPGVSTFNTSFIKENVLLYSVGLSCRKPNKNPPKCFQLELCWISMFMLDVFKLLVLPSKFHWGRCAPPQGPWTPSSVGMGWAAQDGQAAEGWRIGSTKQGMASPQSGGAERGKQKLPNVGGKERHREKNPGTTCLWEVKLSSNPGEAPGLCLLNVKRGRLKKLPVFII